jgi:hypothetical protein
MGKLTQGPFGSLINKTGNLVFQKNNKSNVVKQYNPNPSNPRTASQLKQRELFKSVISSFSDSALNAFKLFYSNNNEITNVQNKVISDTINKYKNSETLENIIPVIKNNASLQVNAIEFNYNIFFDEFSFISPNKDASKNDDVSVLVIVARSVNTNTIEVIAECYEDQLEGVCPCYRVIDYGGGVAGMNTYANGYIDGEWTEVLYRTGRKYGASIYWG